MSIKEHDLVVLTRALPEHDLRTGDVGTVVYVYSGGQAYEVEFVTGAGRTLAVLTLEPKYLRLRGADDILHCRPMTVS